MAPNPWATSPGGRTNPNQSQWAQSPGGAGYQPAPMNDGMADLSRLGLMPSGFPTYQPGPQTSLLPQLDQKLGGIDYNHQGLDTLRTQSLNNGPSQWAQLARKSLGQQTQDAGNELARQSNGQIQTGMSRLASGGGLSSGARERLVRGGAQDAFAGQQNIARGQQEQDTNIGLQDEQNRQAGLRALPGMEAQSAQTQYATQVNPWLQMAQNEQQLREGQSQAANAFNLGRFNTQVGAYNANQTANAQQNAALHSGGLFGGGGFLGLGG